MNMMSVIDVLVIDDCGGDAAEAVAALHEIHELVLELLRVAINDSVGVLTENLHLALVALAHTVALESVLITTLFLAHLAVPSELLEPFCFDPVRDRFRG